MTSNALINCQPEQKHRKQIFMMFLIDNASTYPAQRQGVQFDAERQGLVVVRLELQQKTINRTFQAGVARV